MVLKSYLSSMGASLRGGTRGRGGIRAAPLQLWNFPKSFFLQPLQKVENNYFVYSNNGLQNHFVLTILRGGPTASPEVFISIPIKLSSDGTVNYAQVSPVSKDGSILPMPISRAGSDWDW
jgi:hypothetical protein